MLTTDIAPLPRLDIAESFASLLTGDADPALRLRFIHDSDKEANATEEREGKLSALWPDIRSFQQRGYGVFYFVNSVTCGAASGKGGTATDGDVNAIRAIFADHDDGLPDDWDWHRPPALVVHTSTVLRDGKEVRKGQALWPVAGLAVSEFKTAQHRLAAFYRSDRAVSNPSRVLRLPGTLHQKVRAVPQLVIFEDRTQGQASGLRIRSAEEVLDGLPQADARKPDARSSVAGAPVPPEQLRELLSYLDPNMPRDEWLQIVGGIRATPLPDDDDEGVRRAIAHEWSRGDLDREKRGRPTRFTDDAAVDRAFDTMPPKDDGVTFGTIFRSATACGYNGPPVRPRPAAEVFAGYISEAATADQRRGASAPFLMSESDIFAMPDPTELIRGLLMEKENVCFVGPPKVGKTFIALDIALSIAANLPVFGHLPTLRTGAVVYLSGEGHSGMKRRIKAWRQERRVEPESRLPFFYKPAVPATKQGMVECKRYIEGIQGQLGSDPALVVIDTMARSMSGLNENDSGDANMYLDLTDGLRSALNCTVLTLAHSGKDQKQPIGIRGSSAFPAGFDAVWTAEMNESNRTVRLDAKWLKDAADLGPFCFRLKPISVAGLEHGNGAVLEFASIDDFHKKAAADEKSRSRREVFNQLSEWNIRSADRALETREFAVRRTEERIGREPCEPQRPTAEQKREFNRALDEWQTAVEKDVKHLQNGTRQRGTRPLYDGFFEERTRWGGTQLMKLWFLPESSEPPLDD